MIPAHKCKSIACSFSEYSQRGTSLRALHVPKEDLLYEAATSTLITQEGLHIQLSRDAICTDASVKTDSKNNFSKSDTSPKTENILLKEKTHWLEWKEADAIMKW